MRDSVYCSHTVRYHNEMNRNVTADRHSTADTWRECSLLTATSLDPTSLPSNVSETICMEEKREKMRSWSPPQSNCGAQNVRTSTSNPQQSYRHGAQNTGTPAPDICLMTLAGGYRRTRNLLPTHQTVGLAFTTLKNRVFARLWVTFLC